MLKNILTRFDRSPAESGLILLAFSLPFGGVYNSYFLAATILLTIYGLLSGRYHFHFDKPGKVLVIVLVYFFYAIEIFNHPDFSKSIPNLILKISLLFFPILFSITSRLIDRNIILIAFITGTGISMFICLAKATIDFLFYSHDREVFFYGSFSYFIHPGYYGMYVLFSMCCILFLNRHKNRKVIVWKGIWILLHFAILILVSARTSIIAFAIFSIIAITVYLILNRDFKKGLLLTAAFLAMLFSAVFFLNNKQHNRFNTLISFFSERKIVPSSTESVEARFLVWESSVQVIRENFWIGTGTANVNQALKREYLDSGFVGIAEENLNAHNEFFQTWIATGIGGFIMLVLCVFAGLPNALRQRDFLLLSFIFIIVINFLTESMLERQAGVVFFSFFNSLLIFTFLDKESSPETRLQKN